MRSSARTLSGGRACGRSTTRPAVADTPRARAKETDRGRARQETGGDSSEEPESARVREGAGVRRDAGKRSGMTSHGFMTSSADPLKQSICASEKGEAKRRSDVSLSLLVAQPVTRRIERTLNSTDRSSQTRLSSLGTARRSTHILSSCSSPPSVLPALSTTRTTAIDCQPRWTLPLDPSPRLLPSLPRLVDSRRSPTCPQSSRASSSSRWPKPTWRATTTTTPRRRPGLTRTTSRQRRRRRAAAPSAGAGLRRRTLQTQAQAHVETTRTSGQTLTSSSSTSMAIRPRRRWRGSATSTRPTWPTSSSRVASRRSRSSTTSSASLLSPSCGRCVRDLRVCVCGRLSRWRLAHSVRSPDAEPRL